MKVGWLIDDPGYTGGAELTAAELRAAAPVEVVDCPPGAVVAGLDAYIIHNHLTYSEDDLATCEAPRFRYHHDVRPQRLQDATHIYCSAPLRERNGGDGEVVTPPIEVARFAAPRQSRRRREGSCSVGAWHNPGKGAQLLVEYARGEPVSVFGDGEFAPRGPGIDYRGPIEPAEVAQTLWGFERFVFLPTAFEPFGRCVVEAWAAGLELIVNANVGAVAHLDAAELAGSAERFWAIVCDA